ncbi:hypothetical protein HY636_01490 [Candidatus Woesearchaeota archaeon]|nr:hypothetical protein [Candidatus Woesearchaeota archaeon]
MKIGSTDYQINLALGTTTTLPDKMLKKKAPAEFPSMTLAQLADYVLQEQYKGEQAELAASVQRIMAAKRTLGLRIDYVMEVGGKALDPSKPAAQYIDHLAADPVEKDKPQSKTLYMKVTKRDGGGLYQH